MSDLRPFDLWTPNYVRRGLAEGKIAVAQAAAFVEQFGDGLTLKELGITMINATIILPDGSPIRRTQLAGFPEFLRWAESQLPYTRVFSFDTRTEVLEEYTKAQVEALCRSAREMFKPY